MLAVPDSFTGEEVRLVICKAQTDRVVFERLISCGLMTAELKNR